LSPCPKKTRLGQEEKEATGQSREFRTLDNILLLVKNAINKGEKRRYRRGTDESKRGFARQQMSRFTILGLCSRAVQRKGER